jgi:hypothetical protein
MKSLTHVARQEMREMLRAAETMTPEQLDDAETGLIRLIIKQARMARDMERSIGVLEDGLAALQERIERRAPEAPVNAGDNVVYPERFQARGVDMSRARAHHDR